ncbi:MAG: FAD-dependent oxidoreductase [Bacteroidales bacterium]|nr:FAD-dependent oxidoreductase [Bacteroidales bacterium]
MRQFEITCPPLREPRLDDIRTRAAEELRLRRNAVINVIDPTKSFQPTMVGADATCYIRRRSIDARGDIKMVYGIDAYGKWEHHEEYVLPPLQDVHGAEPVIVVGAGPAGMFAAVKLVSLGLRPIVLERGKDVHRRKSDMASLSRTGKVPADSNYCYGEGGAGAFSDGKLYTRSTKRGDNREVLLRLVEYGADPSILIDTHAHIGSDKLPKVCENLRKSVEAQGGEYHFDAKVTDIQRGDDGVFTVRTADAAYTARAVILATGHSARDIYEMLAGKGWDLEAKGFAMGVRVEHPQSLINKIRYHGQWEPGMPAAEYSFVKQVALEVPADEELVERGVFSFCMCPGGVLVPSATEDGTIVLNGMSNSARSSKWANAGVVVSIEPEDVPQEYQADGPFSLLNFQRDVERRMFDFTAASGATHPLAAPAQRMDDFCNGRISKDLPETSYFPGTVPAPLHELLPRIVAERLQDAFQEVDRTVMRGYYTHDALLLGVESRTSSPVRIPRDENYQYTSVPGLFPCGEGAGYAGGIVSSAIDGINCAVAACRLLCPPAEEEADAETEG